MEERLKLVFYMDVMEAVDVMGSMGMQQMVERLQETFSEYDVVILPNSIISRRVKTKEGLIRELTGMIEDCERFLKELTAGEDNEEG